MKTKKKVFMLLLFVFSVTWLLPFQVSGAQKNGITLTIVANDQGLKDMGHAFLVITNNTSKTLSIGPYSMGKNKQVTLGMRDGYQGHLSGVGGAYYNVEAVKASIYKDFAYKTISVTADDVRKISEFFRKNSYYESGGDLLFHNCTTFAVRAWNLVASQSEQFDEDLVDEPWKLKSRIKKMSGGKTGTSLIGTVLTKAASLDQVYYMRMDGNIIPYCPVGTGFLEIKAVSCNAIKVKWKQASDARISGLQNMVTGYKLYYGTNASNLDHVIKITNVKTTQYKVTGLDAKKKYAFQIVPIFEKYGYKVDGVPSAVNTKKTASCKVKLNKTKVTINMPKKKTVQLNATSTGSHSGTLKKVKWSSNNTSVATVNSSGLVTGKKHGTAVITATIHGVQKKCKVTVNNPTIKLNSSEVSLQKGATYTLSATVTGKSKKVSWKSSNNKVAVVNGGKITAKGEGSATITATANGISAKCKVTVKKKSELPKINKTSVTLIVGSGENLYLTIGSNTKRYTASVTWATSNPKIVYINDRSGRITGINAGTATITATMYGTTCTCKVTVKEVKKRTEVTPFLRQDIWKVAEATGAGTVNTNPYGTSSDGTNHCCRVWWNFVAMNKYYAGINDYNNKAAYEAAEYAIRLEALDTGTVSLIESTSGDNYTFAGLFRGMLDEDVQNMMMANDYEWNSFNGGRNTYISQICDRNRIIVENSDGKVNHITMYSSDVSY